MYFQKGPNSAVNYMARVALCFISAIIRPYLAAEKVGRIGTRTASDGMRKGVDGLERLGRCSDRSERGSKLGIWNSISIWR